MEWVAKVQWLADTARPSPLQFSLNVFIDEFSVVRLEFGNVRNIRALGVEIELVELVNPRLHLHVLVVTEVVVITASVPGVERMESEKRNGGHAFHGNRINCFLSLSASFSLLSRVIPTSYVEFGDVKWRSRVPELYFGHVK